MARKLGEYKKFMNWGGEGGEKDAYYGGRRRLPPRMHLAMGSDLANFVDRLFFFPLPLL